MIFIFHILSSVLDHEVYQEHCCAVLIINLVHNTMTIICVDGGPWVGLLFQIPYFPVSCEYEMIEMKGPIKH